MKYTLLLSLILALIVPLVSEGAEWVLYAASESDGQWYLDKESIIHKSKHVIRVWDKVKYAQPQKIETKFYRELIRYIELDCKEKKLRILQATFYLLDNETLSTIGRDRPKEDWSYIQPGGNNDILQEILCKGEFK